MAQKTGAYGACVAATILFVSACSSNDEVLAQKDREIAELREDRDGVQRELDQSKSVQMLTQQQLEEERRRIAEADARTAAPPPKSEPAMDASGTIGGEPNRPAPKKRARTTAGVKDGHVETESRDDGSTMFRLKGAATFAPGSDKLTKDGLAAVDKIAAELKKTKGAITVEGHTDATPLTGKNKETYGDNLNLSIARAIAVKERLVEKGRIAADRVSVVGHGDSKPLAKGTSKEAHARNRRVEIVVADGD
jgi:flagellar motor protein MotB